MRRKRLPGAGELLTREKGRRSWRKVMLGLASVVVFCTTYALILPAVTMETAACGLEEHIHGLKCYTQVDSGGVLETPETAPNTPEIVPETPEAVPEGPTCGLSEGEEHTHGPLCYSEWELTCGREEHTHSEACRVMGLIAALPGQEEMGEALASFEREQDEEDYLTRLRIQVREAQDAYGALSGELRAAVANAGKLTELDWLLDAEPLDDTMPSIVYYSSGSGEEYGKAEPAAINAGTTGKLTAWLEKKGYQTVEIRAYKISTPDQNGENAAWERITVNYPALGSGPQATQGGSKLFVLDLGPDGTGEPAECKVTEVQKWGEEEKCYQVFKFKNAQQDGTGDAAPHVYAFVSAQLNSLTDLGIYPGEKQTDGTWIAMDGLTPESATVRATVTVPEDAAAAMEAEGYYLFIREIYEGEDFYPTAEAVQQKAGATNGWQCYTLRWLKVDEAGNVKMKPLNEGLLQGQSVTVKIEYLKESAELEGPAGGRKLLIFNSNQNGSLQDAVSDTVTDVLVGNDTYQSFTFTTAHTGPYVFVSKVVEKGYVRQLTVSWEDGSEPFDKTGDLLEDGKTVDIPGNDAGKDNGVVRSYDTILYNLSTTFGARQSVVTEKTVTLFFELTLSKSATAARFVPGQMLWLGENYSIEYLNTDGEVIVVQDHKGEFYPPRRNPDGSIYRDEYGFAWPDTGRPKVKMNALVNGSTAGRSSYKVTSGGIVRQRLVGWTTLVAKEGENILNATRTFSAAVEVRNADNGEVFQPTFKMWLAGNEDNYGSETTENNEMVPAQPVKANEVQAGPVVVSAGTNFNVQLKKNTDMSYKNWFDFSTGQLVEEDRARLEELAMLEANRGKANPAEFVDESGAALDDATKARYQNYRYGRITCYGVTVQLYNATDNPATSAAAKKLKGLSLPVGDITFDLNLYSEAYSGKDENGKPKPVEKAGTEYPAILWDYNENVPANNTYYYKYDDPGRFTPDREDGKLVIRGNGLGNGGRNLFWDGETRSPYAKGGAPSNYISYHNGCYYGGDWAVLNSDGQKVTDLAELNTVASPAVVTGTGADTSYHFAVSDYDFDFDKHHFPTQDAGNSGTITGYDTHALGFSAGCIQVLSVFPRVQKESTTDLFLNVTVNNLQLETRAGQKLELVAEPKTGYEHEVNQGDNHRRDQIVLHAPGSLTKGNSFNGLFRDRAPNSVGEGFLGTEYWTTSYDCSTFAGDNIWIVSYGMMASGSDYHTQSMNLLQLFDSKALSIRDQPDIVQDLAPGNKAGTAKYLYAADPDYPEGYDTNEKDVLAYMNTVREEDLVYSTEMPGNDGYIWVEADNGREKMKCVGVLMELRGCDLLGGKYQYMRIPVKVNGDDAGLVGKTVATVNAFRTWSYPLVDEQGEPLTWEDGVWNVGTGKNELADYEAPVNGIGKKGFQGELANTAGNKLLYVKTEYDKGLQVSGTHAGGTLAGNSLLLLGYKGHIDIDVDYKDPDASKYTYTQDKGETEVIYRLKNIKTELSDLTGQESTPLTTLRVRAVLDEGHTGDQRISVSSNTYHMRGYAVDENGNRSGTESEIAISSDPDHPTELFVLVNGKEYKIKVHANRAVNGSSVEFVIQNAPVGVQLPDITFKANFASVHYLENNDTMLTNAYISGEGDNRAYDKTKGNKADVTVGVALSGGTNLTKEVDVTTIELNGLITYTITYTNSGSTGIGEMYFYDLLPNSEDIRGSKFAGDVLLRTFGATGSTGEAGEEMDPVLADVYYSTIEYKTLYNRVKVFGGDWDPVKQEAVNMNGANVHEMLENEMIGNQPLFELLGTVRGESLIPAEKIKNMTPAEKDKLMGEITGLYVVANDLGPGQTITLTFTVRTRDNQAGNLYKNIANSWVRGTQDLPLTSNMVETAAVSRSISGVVWYDKDLDGIRDDGEKQLEGVTVTLFQKGADGRYVPCTRDVTGAAINPVATNSDGAYSFDRLAAEETVTDAGGKETTRRLEYVVAFSGGGLEEYTGAAAYQQGGSSSVSSDGAALSELGLNGIDANTYLYAIKYSGTQTEIRPATLAEIAQSSVALTNYRQEFTNQDLGVIIAGPELPSTGGSGAAGYTLGGLTLMAGAALWLALRRRRTAV